MIPIGFNNMQALVVLVEGVDSTISQDWNNAHAQLLDCSFTKDHTSKTYVDKCPYGYNSHELKFNASQVATRLTRTERLIT